MHTRKSMKIVAFNWFNSIFIVWSSKMQHSTLDIPKTNFYQIDKCEPKGKFTSRFQKWYVDHIIQVDRLSSCRTVYILSRAERLGSFMDEMLDKTLWGHFSFSSSITPQTVSSLAIVEREKNMKNVKASWLAKPCRMFAFTHPARYVILHYDNTVYIRTV